MLGRADSSWQDYLQIKQGETGKQASKQARVMVWVE